MYSNKILGKVSSLQDIYILNMAENKQNDHTNKILSFWKPQTLTFTPMLFLNKVYYDLRLFHHLIKNNISLNVRIIPSASTKP